MMHRSRSLLQRSARGAGAGRWSLILIALLCLVARPASADEIFRGDFAISNVTVRGIEDGQLVFRAGTGDKSIPLGEIQKLNLDNEPQFIEAMTAFNADQMRSAVTLFDGIYKKSEVVWVKQYAAYFLAQAHDSRGSVVEAAQIYIYLASSAADPFLLSKPPVKSLEEANDNQKARIRDEVMAVINKTDGVTRDRLQTYLRVVVGDGEMPELAPDTGDRQNTERAKSAVILPDSIWKLIEQEDRNNRWVSVKLLTEGKFQEAADDISKRLGTPGDLPEKLYILGRAQLGLADASDNKDLYKDAGLTYMRLVVFFGSSNARPHPLTIPAKLEVAYIHQRIGREDLFNKILRDEGVFVLVDDPQNYPQYRLRYYQIIGEEPPAVEPAQP